ncbi:MULTISPECIES: DUF3768 domain-containing protein [unclassified Sphingopyxis]|uniref:DUF3768 domain-containing protein n=1 Tax=unclassified Sphingopyxis TaxID=2614943 RepID=UPI0007364F6F|nr:MULTISPECIES: DUF3768 domain-containing protein [unclassified Sphingopyxis]KTE36435.1 hypothetical protein ATE62_14670 [Sphingopyxis sp. HIX]KTE83826.1 hypothetical protein ATE72_11825 [Sphingopyxis sp. HXXIV]
MDSENGCTCATPPRAERIARLNDRLRQRGEGGSLMVTAGVSALPDFDPLALALALSKYTAFDEENDPHGERDFGDLRLFGEDMFWKIDYYDLERKFGSPDPADEAVTSRVLTVMLVSEY